MMALFLGLVGRKSFIETMGLNVVSQETPSLCFPSTKMSQCESYTNPRLSTVSSLGHGTTVGVVTIQYQV